MAFIDKRVGRVEFERVHSNPPFASKDFIHRPAIGVYILNALPFVSVPLASLPMRIIAVQTNLVAAIAPCLFMEDQWLNEDHAYKRFMLMFF